MKMKKIVFLLACLWVMSGKCVAQDIFTSGCFVDAFGQKTAAVFKNNKVVFSRAGNGQDFYSSALVVDTVTDDIYWSCNSNPANSIFEGCGRMMKNDEVLVEHEVGTCINAIAFDGNDIYSAGYINDVLESVAAVWKNGETTPLYTYGPLGKRSVVLGLVVVDGVVYACGYYEDTFKYGCVWVNDELYACYPEHSVHDIAYYKGDLYYVVGDLTSTIYKSGQELYPLYNGSGSANSVSDIEVVDGDVYSVGFMGFNDGFVWKNADFLYIHPLGLGADFNACYHDDHNLYYVGWDHHDRGIVFRDGEQLYSDDLHWFYGVFVKPSPLATDEEAKEPLAVYPNPVKETLRFDGLDEGEVVGVFNVYGQAVMRAKSGPDRTIDVGALAPGLYWARVGNQIKPFVKE
jgi:hypothetical protein